MCTHSCSSVSTAFKQTRIGRIKYKSGKRLLQKISEGGWWWGTWCLVRAGGGAQEYEVAGYGSGRFTWGVCWPAGPPHLSKPAAVCATSSCGPRPPAATFLGVHSAPSQPHVRSFAVIRPTSASPLFLSPNIIYNMYIYIYLYMCVYIYILIYTHIFILLKIKYLRKCILNPFWTNCTR
jgi:hypothetical protein